MAFVLSRHRRPTPDGYKRYTAPTRVFEPIDTFSEGRPPSQARQLMRLLDRRAQAGINDSLRGFTLSVAGIRNRSAGVT